MRFTLQYPLSTSDPDPEFATPSVVRDLAQAAEESGFDAVAFTEHPAPDDGWYSTGGHASFDPVVALAFCAAATTRIRLMTYLLVLPYHNPFAAAKSLISLDRLSEGRLAVVAGAGYLAGEFANLGVPHEERNARFDEGLEALRAVWSSGGRPVTFEGRFFRGHDLVSSPAPVQEHLPILIGGNSRASRRRAALHGGWSPLMASPKRSDRMSTAAIGTLEQLAAGIEEVRALARDAGRADAPPIQAQTLQRRFMNEWTDEAEHLEHLRAVEALGVESFVTQIAGLSARETIERVRRYGSEIIAAHRAG